MKNLLLAFVAILCICGCKQRTQAIEDKGPALMVFDNDEIRYNFGNVPVEQDSVVHDFVFTNKGTGSLVINATGASCHCVTLDYPKTPIKPGKKGVIRVKLDLTNQSKGYVNRYAIIMSNSSMNPHVDLTLEGYRGNEE